MKHLSVYFFPFSFSPDLKKDESTNKDIIYDVSQSLLSMATTAASVLGPDLNSLDDETLLPMLTLDLHEAYDDLPILLLLVVKLSYCHFHPPIIPRLRLRWRRRVSLTHLLCLLAMIQSGRSWSLHWPQGSESNSISPRPRGVAARLQADEGGV